MKECVSGSKKNALKPWQKKEWCIPKVSAEFVANMEDMLDLYASLASRLGLSEEGLGSILSGYYEMSAEGVTNLGLLINALESVPAEARGSPSEEGLYELADEDDPGSDEQGVGDGVVEAGPARIVEERGGEEVAEDEGESGLGEFGGVAGQREQTSLPDPELVEIMKQDMGVVTEAGARTLERLAIESKPSTNAAGGGQAVAEARGGAPAGSGATQVLGVDIDQDGKPDVPLYGIDLSSRPGMAWMEQQDRRRNAHVMATMTQYRIGMTRMETVTALGLVTQIELALITYFRESLPEPGQNWDAQKRAREIERRLARLRWVEQQQNDEDSGLKGVWNRVRGRGKPSGKELYRRMIENADAMILGMEEPDRDDDVIAEALRFTGGRPGGPGVPGCGP